MRIPPNSRNRVEYDKSDKLTPRERTPNLKRLDLPPTSVEFIKRLDNGLKDGGPCGVFHVRIEQEDRVLKIFCGIPRSHGTRGVIREIRAYQNLVTGKSCAAGIVSYCYGLCTSFIPDNYWTLPDGNDWLYRFRDNKLEAIALVLEYFPEVTRLSLRNIAPQVVKRALDGLAIIRDDHILHGDLHPRNALVLPGDRVVWVDFDLGCTLPWHQVVHRGSLLKEQEYAWSMFYQAMLHWKCYTLRQSQVRGELQEDYYGVLNLVEQTLLDLGAQIHDYV